MILDAEPNPKGNIVLLDERAHVLKGDLFEERIPEDQPRFMDHHATCPTAEQHSKKKAKK